MHIDPKHTAKYLKPHDKKPPVPFEPKAYVKQTVYIGSEGALVQAIADDMVRKDMKFSPLMIHAFKLFHNLDHGIEASGRKARDESVGA